MEFCMQAPNKIPDILSLKYPCYIQPKLDGYRGVYVPNEGFYSKSGKLFRNNDKLVEYFEDLISVKGYVIEGEFYIPGVKPQYLASYLNTHEAEINKTLKLWVFDCIPIEDWIAKKCTLTYEKRLQILRVQINSVICNYTKVIDIATDITNTPTEAGQVYKDYLKKGYEGCIIREIEGQYQWKRVTFNNGAVLKLKPYETLDLKIVDTFEGQDSCEGMLGGIIVDHEGALVRVGTGFTLEMREKLWEIKNSLIGQIAEIKYLEVTDNKGLRDPRFIRIRDDKVTVDNIV